MSPPAGRVPDFFIIGHEKCGTTALYKMLRNHPQVFMPDFKEPRFFSWDLRVSPPKPGGTFPHSLDEYLALFAPARPDQRVGEASPQYIRSPSAAARIAEVQPDARIVAILREPAAFLRSFHLQSVLSGLESERDLRRALALEQTRSLSRVTAQNTSTSWLMYSEHVRYVEQLQRFRAVFPAANVLVLIYEDYRTDNQAALRQVLRLLEVDESYPLEPLETRRERLQEVRLMGLHRFAGQIRMARHRPQAVGRFARAVNALTPDSLQSFGRRVVYTEPRPPDAELMLELRRRFKPEVEALSAYLDRDLISLWGYDRL